MHNKIMSSTPLLTGFNDVDFFNPPVVVGEVIMHSHSHYLIFA